MYKCFVGVFLWLCATVSSHGAVEQVNDYVSYNKRITQVSLLIHRGEEEQALAKFDSLFSTVDYLYAAHAFMGLQLAAKLQQEELSFKYLEYVMLAGVSKRLISSDFFVKQLRDMNAKRWQKALDQYDQLHQVYVDRVNTEYAKIVDALYQRDQKLTQKVNKAILLLPYYWLRWNHSNKKHVRQLRKLISQHGYPGEKLMGISSLDHIDQLDTTKELRYGFNCFISYHKTLFMLVHYFSKNREGFNKLLWPEVTNGNMSAYEYAAVNDFMAEWGKRKYREQYYNVWHTAPEDLKEQTEANRRALGLCTLQEHHDYREYWMEKRKTKDPIIYLPALL